jgi:hypothetical protein
MKIYSIYKVTNILNGKVYIGFTTNLVQRKHRHKYYALEKQVVNHFYTAIRKHGWENFQWEIIYQSKDKSHCLNEMEKYFIEEYKSFSDFEDSRGYNMTLGGEGCLGNHKPKTKEHSEKISKSLTGKKLSSEHIANAAFARSKQYTMINPNGEVVHIKNMSEFCREHNLNQSHMISVFLGRYGFISHKGYKKYE